MKGSYARARTHDEMAKTKSLLFLFFGKAYINHDQGHQCITKGTW